MTMAQAVLCMYGWTFGGLLIVIVAIRAMPRATLFAEWDRVPLALRALAVLGAAVSWPSTLSFLAAERPRGRRRR